MTDGWVMVPDVFTDADLEPVRREITEVIHQTAMRLVAEGQLSRTYEEEPFETRLARIFAETEKILPPIVVPSRERPETIVEDWDEFNAIRQRYENDRLPGPRRGWLPIDDPGST